VGAEGVTIAIDPAARGFAWARYDGGVLVGCGNIPKADLERVLPDRGARWVMETPQNYGTFGVAHGDLDKLRDTLREIEVWARSNGGTISYVKPFTWKGNVPKQIQHKRVFAILGETEQAIVGKPYGAKYDHNTYDAVALGLWASGRAGRGSTNATGGNTADNSRNGSKLENGQ